MHFPTYVVCVFNLFHTRLFYLLWHSSIPTCPCGAQDFQVRLSVGCVCAEGRTSFTAHPPGKEDENSSKLLKTAVLQGLFIVSACCCWVSPIMLLREKQVFLFTPLHGVRVCSSTDSPPHALRHLCTAVRGRPWPASSSVGRPLLLDCSQWS